MLDVETPNTLEVAVEVALSGHQGECQHFSYRVPISEACLCCVPVLFASVSS